MLLFADLITADGIGVIIGSKILKGTLKERVTGADITHDLIKYCNDNRYRVFLFGACTESNKKALVKLNEQFPGAQFKGQHGFVNGEEIEEVKMKIKKFKPHLLLVGLGSPKQEEFIYENIQNIKRSTIYWYWWYDRYIIWYCKKSTKNYEGYWN